MYSTLTDRALIETCCDLLENEPQSSFVQSVYPEIYNSICQKISPPFDKSSQ